MAGAPADVTGAAAEVLVPGPVLVAAAEVLVPDPVLGLVAAEVTVPVAEAAAEVTVPVAGAPADVTGAAAEVLVPGPVLIAAAEVLVPDPVLGLVPDPVLGPVAAEVTVPVAEAAADVTGASAPVRVPVAVLGPEPELVLGPVAAEVTVPEPTGGVVAACACRENASKTARIPAATIATCTARRAMCRKIGCGMSSSRTNGTDQTRLVVPIISDPKHAGALYFRPYFAVVTRNRTFVIRPQCTYCSATTVQ